MTIDTTFFGRTYTDILQNLYFLEFTWVRPNTIYYMLETTCSYTVQQLREVFSFKYTKARMKIILLRYPMVEWPFCQSARSPSFISLSTNPSNSGSVWVPYPIVVHVGLRIIFSSVSLSRHTVNSDHFSTALTV